MNIQVLIDICLPQRNIILQVCQIFLVQKVIELLIHPLDDVEAYILGCVQLLLLNGLLHVVVKVPGHDCRDGVGVVHHHDLEPIFFYGLYHFNHLCVVAQVGSHITEILIVLLFENKVHHVF
jgi:hypothetical protein